MVASFRIWFASARVEGPLVAAVIAAVLAGTSCGRSDRALAPPPASAIAPVSSAVVVESSTSSSPLEASVPEARPLAPADAAVAMTEAGAPAEVTAPSDMTLVPGGSFTMGADAGGQEDEHPAHKVTLAPFFFDRTEVTNGAWDACVAAKACRPKSESVRSEHPDFNGPNQPVTGITWDDARGYCAWRGKRLPREAEFERAARGGDDRRYAWGNDPPSHDKTVFSSGHPEDVGTHPAGRGAYGEDDLAGNVWEWMQDEYDPYAYRRPTAGEGTPGSCAEIMATLDELRREHKQGFTGSNPIPDECEHSIRGGAYNYDPDGLRATNRVHHPGRYRIPMLGLRCARDVTVPATEPADAAASPGVR